MALVYKPPILISFFHLFRRRERTIRSIWTGSNQMIGDSCALMAAPSFSVPWKVGKRQFILRTPRQRCQTNSQNQLIGLTTGLLIQFFLLCSFAPSSASISFDWIWIWIDLHILSVVTECWKSFAGETRQLLTDKWPRTIFGIGFKLGSPFSF